MIRIVFIMILSVHMLWLSGCNGSNAAETRNGFLQDESDSRALDTIPVRVVQVKRDTFVQKGVYYGAIKGDSEAQLIASGGGRVQNIYKKEGQKVSRGKKLCDIDGEKFSIQLETAKIAEDLAKNRHELAKRHFEAGTYSETQVQQAKLDYLQSRATRIIAEENWKGAYCISPVSGVLSSRNIEVFQQLTPSTPTMMVSDIDKIKISVGVPESDIMGYKPGNPVKITVKSFPDKVWAGIIESVAASSNGMDKTFRVEIKAENPERVLKPGLTARVELAKDPMVDQIIVPTSSIVQLSQGQAVMVVEGESAVERKIQTGPSSEHNTVIGTGVEPGEWLIVAGQSRVVDGSPVKVISQN